MLQSIDLFGRLQHKGSPSRGHNVNPPASHASGQMGSINEVIVSFADASTLMQHFHAYLRDCRMCTPHSMDRVRASCCRCRRRRLDIHAVGGPPFKPFKSMATETITGHICCGSLRFLAFILKSLYPTSLLRSPVHDAFPTPLVSPPFVVLVIRHYFTSFSISSYGASLPLCKDGRALGRTSRTRDDEAEVGRGSRGKLGGGREEDGAHLWETPPDPTPPSDSQNRTASVSPSHPFILFLASPKPIHVEQVHPVLYSSVQGIVRYSSSSSSSRPASQGIRGKGPSSTAKIFPLIPPSSSCPAHHACSASHHHCTVAYTVSRTSSGPSFHLVSSRAGQETEAEDR
ncbi:hypothetical protein B0H12DRAFT_1122932 [Mycena haematopus]|nr:hypothetical protein B0H12DRAFT_1122932 [Mycena haematopus]